MIGWAIASARLGERDTAMVVLQNMQEEYKNTPLGGKAEKTLKEMQHWKWGVQHSKRRNRPNEPPPPSPAPTSGGITP
jgi:hypothetical protein